MKTDRWYETQAMAREVLASVHSARYRSSVWWFAVESTYHGTELTIWWQKQTEEQKGEHFGGGGNRR